MKRIVLLSMVFLLLMSASGCKSGPTVSDGGVDFPIPSITGQEGTFVPVLAPTSSTEKAVIMVPRFFRDPTYEDAVTRLNEMLDKQGQNVRFVLEANTYTSQGDTGSYIPKVKAELLSGNTTADAYAVYHYNAKNITDNAPTMDLAALLPTAAPIYYGKHKDVIDHVFGGTIPGLPIGMSSFSYRIQAAFMLRTDFEEQYNPKINTIGDVFSFVDNNIVANKKVCSVLADPRMLTQLWAVEQGFYPLEFCNIGGYLFAQKDDKECKPVALEKIPGFYDFIGRMSDFYKKGYFVYPTYSTNGWENIGIVRNLGDYYQPDTGNRYSWVNGKFIAHELYSEYPSFYADGSYFAGDLLIPANSQKAADIIKFVEWLYSDQNNYNMLVYGEEGVDYAASNGRVSFLIGGEPAIFKDRTDMNRAFTAWPGGPLFSSSDYNLLMENAPTNIEQLFDNGQGEKKRFSLDAYMMNAKNMDQIKLLDPTDEMQAVIGERNRLMENIIYAMFMQGGDYQMSVKPLENLKNDWLVEEYAYRIAKFIKSIS